MTTDERTLVRQLISDYHSLYKLAIAMDRVLTKAGSGFCNGTYAGNTHGYPCPLCATYEFFTWGTPAGIEALRATAWGRNFTGDEL